MKLHRLKYYTNLLLIFFAFSLSAKSQRNIQKDKILSRNQLWNISYNNHDTLKFYSLFDTSAIITSAGGKWIGNEDCKRLCRFLYTIRPDIKWYNYQTKIELSDDLGNAYETGNWIESWTEKGDTKISELKGKYWIMYIRRDNNVWYIQSAIFTPLLCIGSYCND
jgi:hypothetical protein